MLRESAVMVEPDDSAGAAPLQHGGDLADAPQRVVRPVAGGPDDHRDRRGTAGSAPGDPLRDIEHGGDPGLVVGEIDDHHALPDAEQVQPTRGVLG